MKLLIVWAITIIATIPALPALAVNQHEEYLDWYYARQKIKALSLVYDDSRIQLHELPIGLELRPQLRPVSKEREGVELGSKDYQLFTKDGSALPDTLAEDYRDVSVQRQEYEEVYPWALGLGITIVAWNVVLLAWAVPGAIRRVRLREARGTSLDRED